MSQLHSDREGKRIARAVSPTNVVVRRCLSSFQLFLPSVLPVGLFRQLGSHLIPYPFLQLYWGLPLEITPSVYAYSLLYPYTDNFLDNPDVNSDEKIKFNRRLSGVLNGEKLTPTNFIEEKVFSLVGQIESQYSRDKFPEVFESLRFIQKAQIESVKQDKDEQLACDEILRISFSCQVPIVGVNSPFGMSTC